MVKFLTSDLESLQCEPTCPSCDWGSRGGYMVSDVMFDGLVDVVCY